MNAIVPIRRAAATPANARPAATPHLDMLVRAAIAAVIARPQSEDPAVTATRSFPSHIATAELIAVARAVTNPASTADAATSALLAEAWSELVTLMAPISVFASLPLLRLEFGASGRIHAPVRVGRALRGAFVGEGQPIPVRGAALGGAKLEPHKVAVITT